MNIGKHIDLKVYKVSVRYGKGHLFYPSKFCISQTDLNFSWIKILQF